MAGRQWDKNIPLDFVGDLIAVLQLLVQFGSWSRKCSWSAPLPQSVDVRGVLNHEISLDKCIVIFLT